jgi:multiple sugar transport system ATP-binding protein
MGGIALEHVSKVYPGDVHAVRAVDLDVADGEFMVLVGPSGCGKSTLLRMVAGLEGVSGGHIRIGDREVTELAPRDRDVAMVFQNYALYPQMKVWDNLAFALRLRRTPKLELARQVGAVAETLGLEELVERKPGALSGGQRQRVAIGRAMVREPRAYLMDEPLSNLDAKLRVSMRSALARLHDRLGVTTLYVTHDQVEAMTLGDRVAVMRDGIIQQCDTPQALFERPLNLFVAAFMGSPSMNLLPGRAGDGVLRFAGVEVPLVKLGVRVEGEVVVGVRPSDLHPAGPDVHAGLPQIEAELEVVERLGTESHLIFPLDAAPLQAAVVEVAQEAVNDGEEATLLAGDDRLRITARVEGRQRFTVGQRVPFAIDPDGIHLFDPQTGAALR